MIEKSSGQISQVTALAKEEVVSDTQSFYVRTENRRRGVRDGPHGQIQQALLAESIAQGVCKIASLHLLELDATNIATALHRAAKYDVGDEGSLVIDQLLSAASSVVPQFVPRELSTTAWALA